MSGLFRVRQVIAALLAMSAAAHPALASISSDLARCAGIAASDARLACYDALAGRSTAAPAAPARVSPTATAASTAPVAAAVTAAPVATAAAAAPSAAGDPKNFGLSPAQVNPTPPSGPTAIQARVVSVAGGGAARMTVQLDNGQTWMFTEAADDARLGSGDAVTIKRASLGSFILATPSHRTYHVHRLQ